MESLPAASRLVAALAIGLLIGLERGWSAREGPEGSRVAGLRTFALIGLLGGLLGLPAEPAWALAAGTLSIALLFAASFARAAATTGTLSITSAVAALVTYALGALAAAGHVLLAVGVAAVVALLLGMKDELHRGMRRIAPAELTALLQLAVLSAAILPLLPDRGFGPYAALNPFRLWLAVILIATLSLAGHVAARWRGAEQGMLWAGVLGSVASSTAATLALARAARAQPALGRTAAASIVAAGGVMFLRMAVVVAVLQPTLALPLAGPLVLLGAMSSLLAAWLWRQRGEAVAAAVSADGKVFDLPTAFGFGLLLGAVALAVRAAKDFFGDAGLYAVAFLSGLADVDAILISSIQLAAQGAVSTPVASHAIGLAVLANMGVKAVMAWAVGGREVGLRVLAAGAWLAGAMLLVAVVTAR